MQHIIIELSKYIMALLIAIYTFQCFSVFRYAHEKDRAGIYFRQNITMVLIHFIAFLVLALYNKDPKYLLFYFMQEIVLLLTIVGYHYIYPKANRLIINNMCMLLSIGFIILSRLSYNKAKRQFVIAFAAIIVTFLIPFIIRKIHFFSKFMWMYFGIGLFALTFVLLFSNTVYGSKLNVTIANYTFQPSEFVKILFVFGMAALLRKSHDLKTVIISAIMAGAHVLILVLSKDLGSALIFFVVYFAMLYVSTENIWYYLFGFGAGSAAAVAGYFLFSHVRVRVTAYADPFGTIENEGYQIAQSLFAIGTGGWFGMGLCQGAPGNIPVVEADFIFAAITEEMGVLFGLCLLLICVSCFVMFMNISMQFKDLFYKLVALGLSVAYGIQVFLTIGGVTKFIPLTGVTLPLVSYGGTSVIVTLIVFSIIQGLYISASDRRMEANVHNAYINGSSQEEYLHEEDLQDTELQDEDLVDADLQYVDLQDVDLLNPDLQDTGLQSDMSIGFDPEYDEEFDYRVDISEFEDEQNQEGVDSWGKSHAKK